MTTHHLPISIPDILHGKTVEWERLEFKTGWNPEAVLHTLLSFPGPDRSIRMEDLRRGKAVSRRYRNRRIGEFLKELELTEGRSTGIPKMLRVMAENGSPVPEFETDEDRTHYLVRLPVHADADWQDLAATPQVTHQVTPQVADPVTDPVTDPVKKLILGMPKNPISPKDLRSKLEIKHKPTFRVNYLDPALEAEFIEMTQPDSPNSPTQKYRLTPKGRELLKTL